MKRKQKFTIILLSVLFALLLTVALLGYFVWGWFEEKTEDPVLPTLEEGESYYYLGGKPVGGVVLMFPQLTRSDLCEIKVHNTDGENYFFFHNLAYGSNYFALGQCDDGWEWGESNLYYPPILEDAVGAFDYTSLYDDTSTIPQMLAAVGAVNIADRIKPEEGVDFETWLSHFGLAKEDDPAYFELVTYLRDRNGNYIYGVTGETNVYVGINPLDGKYYYIDVAADNALGAEYTGAKTYLTPMADTQNVIRVYVGNPTIDDNGYYLYLEGREVVYTTTSTYLPDVVERDIGYYVFPRLVSESESQYAYQLTPNLTYWKGAYFGIESHVELDGTMRAALTALSVTEVDSDNGRKDVYTDHGFWIDLSDGTLKNDWISILSGKTVGDEPFDAIISMPNLFDAMPGEAATYTVYAVSGILRDGEYLTEAGTAVTAGDLAVVLYGDGMTDLLGLPITNLGLVDTASGTDLARAVLGMRIGEEAAPKTVSVIYAQDAPSHKLRFEIQDLVACVDGDGNELDTVAYGSTVRLTYALFETDRYGTETPLGTVTTTLTIPREEHYGDLAKWESEYGYLNPDRQVYTMRSLFDLILGKTVGAEYTDSKGNSSLRLELSYPVEDIADFVLYEDVSIGGAVSYKEELSFGFTNKSDVYYGSALYEILGPADKTLYGIDYTASLNVIGLFENLSGTETVALGLTDEVMLEYGLYAYRLYYELPYDIYSITQGGLNYYYHRNKVGFTLFISEKQADGSRYIASEQYDIVVRYEAGSDFDFLEWDFEKNWVQNNLLLVSYEDLRQLVFDVNYEDYSHVWGFDICVDRDYYYKSSYTEGGEENVSYTNIARLYASLVDGGEGVDGNTYRDLISVLQYGTPYANRDDYSDLDPTDPRRIHTVAGRFVRTYSDSLRYITELQNGRDLDELYYEAGITEFFGGSDYGGAYYTKTLLQILNGTRYSGTVEDDLRAGLPAGMTPEEQDAAIAARIGEILSDEDSRVLTMAMTLDDGEASYGYVFRFYNYSYHSLVSISRVDEAGNETTSGVFYIQAREVAKIANAVISLSQAEPIDPDRY